MKRIGAAMLLSCLALLLSGCSVQERLHEIGQSYKDNDLDTPQSVENSVDWSFVPALRERSQALFAQVAPDAEITETAVAIKSGRTERVIVEVHYMRKGIAGVYGFDYEKDDSGEYVLSRYGDGVDDEDL